MHVASGFILFPHRETQCLNEPTRRPTNFHWSLHGLSIIRSFRVLFQFPL